MMEFVSEKITFFLWVHLTIVITGATVFCQWLLLYIYGVFLPILITFRLWFYFKVKWQLFLLDFCYFTNLVCYVYVWAGPSIPEFFYAMYGMAHGPVLIAAIMYRNSLVFHSLDRMTSCFIHLMPPLVTFGIRWYPDQIRYWVASFVSNQDRNFPEQAIWMLALPMGVLAIHTTFYCVLMRIVRPSEEYLSSYSYLTEADSGIWPKLFKKVARKWRPFLYSLMLLLLGAVSFLLNFFWYNYFYANVAVLLLVLSLLIWNSGTFYIDVFRRKGMDAEPYSIV